MKTTLFTWSVVAGLLLGLVLVLASIVLPRRPTESTEAVQIQEPRVSPKLLPIAQNTPTPVPIPEATPTPTPTPVQTQLLQQVPFTSQAPLAQWNDPVFQDGCEEASLLMAMHWVNRTAIGGPAAATAAIQAMSDFELAEYGEFRDRSAADTAQLMRDYFGHQNVAVRRVTTADDIKAELAAGMVVITPMDGRALGNPNFTAPGPERHMLVVIGYDPATDTFITNDPGTRQGAGYRYNADVFLAAIRDYPTGYHEPITRIDKQMIVIGR